MPKTHQELISKDPAWPALAKEAKAAANAVVVLPPDNDRARQQCLEALQVTTRSTLGALAYETGGLLVDHGFLRIHGSGHPRLPRALGAWNSELDVPMNEYLLIADDIAGGAFAINAGGLGESVGKVYYFAPDSLDWEDTELGHSDWLSWAFDGDLETFYETMRWPDWKRAVSDLAPDRAFNFHPPLWTEDDLDISERDRRAVPVKELWLLQQQFAATLSREEDDSE